MGISKCFLFQNHRVAALFTAIQEFELSPYQRMGTSGMNLFFRVGYFPIFEFLSGAHGPYGFNPTSDYFWSIS